MVKLQSVPTTGASSTLDYSIIGSICILITMVVTLLGIKLKWFRHRLTFEGVPATPTPENNRNESEVVLLSGVFRRTEDFDSFVDIEQPKILPPVRIGNSASSTSSTRETTPKLILPKPKIKTKRAPDIPNGNFTPVAPTIPFPTNEDPSIQRIYPNERFVDNLPAETSTVPQWHVESETPPAIPKIPSPQKETFKKVVPKPPERVTSVEAGTSKGKTKLPPPPPYQYKDPLKNKEISAPIVIQIPDIPASKIIQTPAIATPEVFEIPKQTKSISQPTVPVPLAQPVKITDGPYIPPADLHKQLGKKKEITPSDASLPGPSKRGFFGFKSKSTEPKQQKKPKPQIVRVLKQPKTEKVKDKAKEKNKEKEKSKDKKKVIASTDLSVAKPKEMIGVRPGVTFADEDTVIPSPMERTSGIDYRFDYKQSDTNNNSPLERNSEINDPITIKFSKVNENEREITRKPNRIHFADDDESDDDEKGGKKDEEIDSWNMIARHKQNISHTMAAQLEARKTKLEIIRKQKEIENSLRNNNNARSAFVPPPNKDQTLQINRPRTLREMQNDKRHNQVASQPTKTHSGQHNSDTEA